MESDYFGDKWTQVRLCVALTEDRTEKVYKWMVAE